VTKRKCKTPKGDVPRPWEDRPVSLERWRRHRHLLMVDWAYPGQRPPEWWVYEKGLEPPRAHQADILRHMGELDEAELETITRWWRERYDHACENFPGDPAGRRNYLNWQQVPRDLIRKWDGKRKGNAKIIRKHKIAAEAAP
jgi:hypothetical protein